MKKFIILLLAVALAACSAPATPTEQPVAAPPEPTSTPVVVVQTVVVEATQVPTEPPPPTEPPTSAPAVVTVVVQPTQAPAEAAPTQPAANDGNNAPIALDNSLGKGVFVNMTMSTDAFTLRCFPRDITFNVTANNPAIVDALLYYRMVDKPNGLYPSEWKNGGKMVDNGNGNFSIVFSGEKVDPNIRLDGAWFDFQFVGLSKSGDVVDRSQKIERLVTYTFDCP